MERTVTSVALVTISSHGNQGRCMRETPVKVRRHKPDRLFLELVMTCLNAQLAPLVKHLWHLCPPECNCHNKATDCFYNQTVADLSLSLNIHGVRRGGGVCVSCLHNTAGLNCESCADGYYRPAEVIHLNTAETSQG